MIGLAGIFSLALLHVISGSPTKTGTDFQPEICHLEKLVGSCKGKLERYYYDIEKKNCSTFSYGGCDANANNFETFEQCNKMCDPELEAAALIHYDHDHHKKQRDLSDTCSGSCSTEEICREVFSCHQCKPTFQCVSDTITCDNITCQKGQQCGFRQVQCFGAPCYPVAECQEI